MRGGARLLASLLMFSLVSPVQAAPRGCEMVQALRGTGTASLRGIRAETDRDGRISIRYRNRETPLLGASSCEILGPTDIFEVACTWSNETDLVSARRIHSRLKDALSPCFVGGLETQDRKSGVEGLELSDELSGTIVDEQGDAVDLRLEIHHYAKIDGSYAVILSISR